MEQQGVPGWFLGRRAMAARTPKLARDQHNATSQATQKKGKCRGRKSDADTTTMATTATSLARCDPRRWLPATLACQARFRCTGSRVHSEIDWQPSPRCPPRPPAPLPRPCSTHFWPRTTPAPLVPLSGQRCPAPSSICTTLAEAPLAERGCAAAVPGRAGHAVARDRGLDRPTQTSRRCQHGPSGLRRQYYHALPDARLFFSFVFGFLSGADATLAFLA